MNILKTIGKFLAGILVLLGITIFIMSYFGAYAVNNFPILEKDINDLNPRLRNNVINGIKLAGYFEVK